MNSVNKKNIRKSLTPSFSSETSGNKINASCTFCTQYPAFQSVKSEETKYFLRDPVYSGSVVLPGHVLLVQDFSPLFDWVSHYRMCYYNSFSSFSNGWYDHLFLSADAWIKMRIWRDRRWSPLLLPFLETAFFSPSSGSCERFILSFRISFLLPSVSRCTRFFSLSSLLLQLLLPQVTHRSVIAWNITLSVASLFPSSSLTFA